MEDFHEQFVAFSPQNIEPTTPRLSLSIEPETTSGKLSVTLPYPIDFTISRSQNDGDTRPVIFRWSTEIDGFTPSGIVLIKRNIANADFERINIDMNGLVKLPEEDRIVVDGYNQSLWQLAPGESTKFRGTLPARYQTKLIPGEKYELIWPGCEISMWKWGSIQDNMNLELTKDPGMTPRLVIPGGSRIAFTAEKEIEPWPERASYEAKVGFTRANLQEQKWRHDQRRARQPSPPPLCASERDPDAPVLTASLECSASLSLSRDERFYVDLNVTLDDASPRPITFHFWALDCSNTSREGWRLYRRLRTNEWEKCKDDDSGFMIVDDPDVSVCVGRDPNFATLRPGESWTTSRQIHHKYFSTLPDDVHIGDVFRCAFKGATVDWWDWGSKEEHSETVVKLPCWIAGAVTEPANNSRRPRLVVPGTEAVELSIAE